MSYKLGDKVLVEAEVINTFLRNESNVVVELPNNVGRWCISTEHLRPAEPKSGDWVWVRNEDGWKWIRRIYVGRVREMYATIDHGHEDAPYPVVSTWNQMRTTPPTHEITIEGKTIELSEESFEALKKELCDD